MQPTARARSTTPPEGRVVGDYRLERRLGRGAMGEVWLGRHIRTDVQAAVKILRRDLAASGRLTRLFARERRAVARLQHPHIVGLFDVGAFHLATAFIEGTTLARRLEAPIEPSAAIAIALQIASALAHAHGRGVVHRDVKPSNILLDLAGNAYLADFGLAALVDEDDGAEGGGTPQFMAPEQAAGAAAGPSVDQYALGRTLLEMLVGGRISTDPDQALSQAPAGLPLDLIAAIGRATARDPTVRWPSVEAFATALAGFDLTGARAPARLLPEVRVAAPFAWAAGAIRVSAVGAEIHQADYRLSALESAGLLPAEAVARFRDQTGLEDLGWSMVGSSVRLGPLTSPAALARAGELVVFVHGSLCTRAIWNPVSAPIARDNPQALMLLPDLAGFGESTYRRAPTGGLRGVLDSVLAWLELLGVRELPLVLAGHSMGAMAILTATTSELGPRTSRVAMSPVFPRHDRTTRRQLAAAAALIGRISRYRRPRQLLGWLLLERAPAARHYTEAERRRLLEQFHATPPEVIVAHIRAMLEFEPVAAPELERCAILIAAADPLSPLSVVERAIDQLGLPRSNLHVLASSGHYPIGEQQTNPGITIRTVHEIVHLVDSMLASARDGTVLPTQLESTLIDTGSAATGSTSVTSADRTGASR